MSTTSIQDLQSTWGLEYSPTNVQVEGVDEADTLKTDGAYIYLISYQQVVIVAAFPAEKARISSRTTVIGTPMQIFINRERLVVFCENISYGHIQTYIHVYDTSRKESPALKRTVAVNGHYSGSRMIGDYVYVIITKPAYLVDDEVELPTILTDNENKTVPASEIYYSDLSDYPYAFSTIVALNVQDDLQEPTDKTILSGHSTKLYVSSENIYLAAGCYDRTFLHRIHAENGEIQDALEGEVFGTVLNQFSMDEYDGYFRIATTSPTTDLLGRTDSSILQTQNNIYVLNMEMKIVSEIEGIAPGEQIHSARFMGAKCYLVTFKKTDPFFVIDLSDPYQPEILGELKIDGYSDYLHPCDESHVVGVGKDTVEAQEGNFAWYQGIKISLLDVADVAQPKEVAKYIIGDRGSDTPVLQDHKAFLFDREKSLLVLPVLVAEVNASNDSRYRSPNTYGEPVWQGAYVFTISLEDEDGIRLKGRVTHIEDGNLRNHANHIVRSLYIEDVLYTVSDNKIKMNSLQDLKEINVLSLNR